MKLICRVIRPEKNKACKAPLPTLVREEKTLNIALMKLTGGLL